MAVVPEVSLPPKQIYKTTTKRTLNRRGVLWLGQTCNLRCYFCYFLNRIADTDHPEHPFMELDKAKEIFRTLRYTYGNTAIDIQGGEPTIHPDILEMIRYCEEIGLFATLITNGLVLAKKEKLQEFKDAGIRDFLVSLHGIGDIHDEVVCRKGAYVKIIQAIENMRDLDVPFRFNCTMSSPVIPLLPEIAQKAVEYGANGVNFIAFNPFEDQETGIRTHDNVAKYADIKPKLSEAMDILEEAGIECNVRYLPLCVVDEKYRKNFYNFQQLPYDHHEWDYSSWNWTGLQPQRMKPEKLVPAFLIGPFAREFQYRYPGITRRYYERPVAGKLGLAAQHIIARLAHTFLGKDRFYRSEGAIRAQHDAGYEHVSACKDCSLKDICDGFHCDYTDLFSDGEATSVKLGTSINDPKHYIREQIKIVEPEDETWAL